MKKTNFDLYLEEKLQDPAFAKRFHQASAAWDVALQLASLRQRSGLSQKALARRLKTSQQQISRLESPAYRGHSMSMLRRVAHATNHKVRVVFEPLANGSSPAVKSRHAKSLARVRPTAVGR
jgi:transcriptional regulator with XRE-family HTH domain